MLRTALKRTPGVDMTQTIKKQASNYLILCAIRYVSNNFNLSHTLNSLIIGITTPPWV